MEFASGGMYGRLGAGEDGGWYRHGRCLMPSLLTVSPLLKLTTTSWLSSMYSIQDRASCFWLLKQLAVLALSLARLSAGSSMDAKIAMMAMTTNNSMSVNAARARRTGW